ncbi:hypothetical protein CEXT_428031 [Caerostris extrusa]|uniref:Uncharacterized protein n=1 Tax=Caerostris extrusa TaxID=172846 RepID=A0AAV4V848_CAEEX|nr:hypothetical protein CEXT_428031 [Caerostris extrusa]
MPCFTSCLTTEIAFNKSIRPHVSEATKYFERRRQQYGSSLNSLEDQKSYEFLCPKNIQWLSLINPKIYENDSSVKYAVNNLWKFIAEKDYSRKELAKEKFTRSYIMEFLEQNKNPNGKDCLICFICTYSKYNGFQDKNEIKILKEK